MKYNNIKNIVFVISFIFLSLLNILSFMSSFGVSLFLYFGTKLFFEIGEKIIIKDVLIIIALMQWIIGPILAYNFNANEKMYFMAVTEEVYMQFVVPASFFLILGLYLPLKKNETDQFYINAIKKRLISQPKLDIIILAIGIVVIQTWRFAPVSLKFFIATIGNLQYIGILFILLNPKRSSKRLYVFLVFGLLAVSSMTSGMFHDFILWTFFILLFAAFIKKPSVRKKAIYLVVFLALIISIQTIKHSFREALREGTGEGVSLFADLVQEEVLSSDYATSETNLSAMVTRINQGWIIARIMSWTPSHEPFAGGETIMEAIKSSFMPRFLFPNKVTAGGRTYFTRFTGKDISDQTSMGLGLVGEAYANYGINGGAFFMFIIGFFYNFFLSRIYKIAKKHPAIIFFIPLLFLQVVKAETDFSVILNHLMKATVVVWAIFFGLRKFLKIKI